MRAKQIGTEKPYINEHTLKKHFAGMVIGSKNSLINKDVGTMLRVQNLRA